MDPGADPGFVERGGGGGAQRLSRVPQAQRFLEGPVWRPSLEFQKWGGGGARPPPLNPLVGPIIRSLAI